ncbi:hypothetical protein TRFO_33211 [Tritrichomonas foetus]|uniref:Uncharacterized protein n=1 Tax=Tritrichomonas foetus TaxID=1144522 RepID=A0A1J4JSF9_9EUKA|nr:hypothetical protein TRFO_33211 [Tritrichomonas foetus]|eukprot:OHT00181.1 hypothetical protein TRFO_33211 [Tritrichomonas foetus]
MVLFSTTSESTKPALELFKKNPQEIVPILALSSPFDFFYDFLKKTNCNFDILPLLAKIGDTIMFNEAQDIKYVLKTLILLIDMLDESSHDAIWPVIRNLTQRMNKDENNEMKTYIFEALAKAETKKLVKYENIKVFYDLSNPEYQRSILRSFIFHIDEDDAKSHIYDILFEITAKRATKPFAELLRVMVEYSDILRSIDENKYKQVYERIFNPIPKTEKLQLLIIRLLSFTSDREKLMKYVYSLTSGQHTKEYNLELKQLITNFHVTIDFQKLDWFNDYCQLNLYLFDNIKTDFILELLSYNLVLPENLSYVIDVLCQNPTIAGPLGFTSVFTLLKAFADQMGFSNLLNFEKMKLNLNFENTNWLKPDELTDLYLNIHHNVIDSSFGQILNSLLHALLILKDNVTLTDSLVVAMTMICRVLSSSAPGITADIVVSLHKDVQEEKVPMSAERKIIYNEQMKLYFDEHFSMIDSPRFIRALITCFGLEAAINEHSRALIDAVSKDIDLASEYSSALAQPLPKMTTFLYFVDEKHSEWVNECRSFFKFNSWQIKVSDAELAGNISDITETRFLDDTHLRIYHKLKGIEHEEPKFNVVAIPEPLIFEFHPNPSIREGPATHTYEPPTMFGVISYLWHSKYELPSTITNIEEFALSNSDDIRMTIGFLTYAHTHKIPVASEKWITVIKVIRDDELSIFAGSLVLNFVTERNDEVNQFINSSLDTLGYYDHSNEAIVQLYGSETGMNWQFIRSIIGTDKAAFQKLNNLIVLSEFSDVTETPNIIAEALQIISENQNYSAYSLFVTSISTSFLFNRAEMKCTRLLPTNYDLNQRLLMFTDTTEMQKPLFIGSGIIDSIISVLDKLEGDLTFPFITILVNLASSDEQYTHIIHLIHKRVGRCADFSRYIMIHAKEYIDADEVMTEFLNYKPPSFMRAFFRSVWKKRKANISSDMKSTVLLLYKSLKEHTVFPDLCYFGMSKISMEPWKQATNYTKLRLGFTDLQTIMGSHTEIGPHNGESILMFKPISLLCDSDFYESRAWPDAASAKKDFVKVLLEAATSEGASIDFTNDVFTVLTKNSSIVDIAEIVLDKEFMNKGKFSSIILIFRKLETLLVAAEMEELVHKCMDYHNPKKMMFDDEQKIDAFYNPNDEKSIFISLKIQNTKEANVPEAQLTKVQPEPKSQSVEEEERQPVEEQQQQPVEEEQQPAEEEQQQQVEEEEQQPVEEEQQQQVEEEQQQQVEEEQQQPVEEEQQQPVEEEQQQTVEEEQQPAEEEQQQPVEEQQQPAEENAE